jgi:hypothetical protein
MPSCDSHKRGGISGGTSFGIKAQQRVFPGATGSSVAIWEVRENRDERPGRIRFWSEITVAAADAASALKQEQ